MRKELKIFILMNNDILEIYNFSDLKSESYFNIFKILQLDYDKVRLHSRILKFFIEEDPIGFINTIPE